MFKKILVCLDGSDSSLEAARLGASIAQQFGSEVLALNVFEAPYLDYAYLGTWAVAMDMTTIERFAQNQKDQVEARVKPVFEQFSLSYKMIQEVAHPVDGILRVAEKEGVDLIVIGSRGLHGVKKFFLGSVSNSVVHHAECSVLVAR